MATSIFNGNPMYLPPVQYNLQDYIAPDLGIQASAGQTPYDRWLFEQNSRMGDISLPSFSVPYTAVNPSNPYQAPSITPAGTAPGSGGVYDTNPYQPPAPVYQPPAPTPAPEPTYQSPQSTEPVVGPYSNAPQSAEEIARLAIRHQMQSLVGSGDREAALNYMIQQGITPNEFNEMLSYSGSPIPNNQSASNWLINSAQQTGIQVPGLSYASPEEVQQFLQWQGSSQHPLYGGSISDMWAAQGIEDPYTDPRLADLAQDAIASQTRLQDSRNSNGMNWTPEYQNYTPQDSAPQTSPMTQVQSNPAMVQAPAPAPVPQAPPQPQYQQVAGSFVNQDTGDIVNYDSNGVHTSTGRVDSAWQAAHQPAPQPTQQTVAQPSNWWDANSENRARGGLIKLSQKYASGGGVNALAGKYNLY